MLGLYQFLRRIAVCLENGFLLSIQNAEIFLQSEEGISVRTLTPRNHPNEQLSFMFKSCYIQYVSEQMPLDYAPLQNAREVATFFALPAGDFVVMPNSVQHREGKFLLRILADQHADVWEINEDNLVVHSIQNDFGDDRTVEYVSIVSSILVKAIDFH